MKVAGSATLHAPAERVWSALNDPAVLVRTIPGCERLEVSGPDAYHLTVTAGVASVRGTYTGQIALTERQQPTSFLLTASGVGGPGTVNTTVRVRLEGGPDGYTQLSYDADAVVGGMIAGVGQRMLGSVAKRMAGEFFTAVDGVLAGELATAGGPATGGGPVPAGGPATAGGPAAGGGPVPAPATAGGQATGGGPLPAGGSATAGQAAAGGPTVFTAPRRAAPATAAFSQGFQRGLLVGAAVALAGAAVGGLIARRAR
jgi:uncharacterized protein